MPKVTQIIRAEPSGREIRPPSALSRAQGHWYLTRNLAPGRCHGSPLAGSAQKRGQQIPAARSSAMGTGWSQSLRPLLTLCPRLPTIPVASQEEGPGRWLPGCTLRAACRLCWSHTQNALRENCRNGFLPGTLRAAHILTPAVRPGGLDL